MAADHRLARRALTPGFAVALALVATALAAVGSGPINGDAAVYAHQARVADLGERVVHVGYLAVAAVLGQIADPALALDLVSVLAVAGWVAAAAAIARQRGNDPAVAAVVTAGVGLSIASWAEVDPLWIALVAASVLTPSVMAAALVAVAVAVSPTALLAIPVAWVGRTALSRAGWPLAVGAAAAVFVLTLGTWGAWWVGDRGVLAASAWLPGRVAGAWLVAVPLWLALVGRRWVWGLVACVPALLAPPDVPGWAAPATVLATSVPSWAALSRTRRVVLAIAVTATVAVGVVRWWHTWDRVAAERALVEATVADLSDGDGVVAPWSLGVRVSLAATGDPYALRWRTRTGFVRDQAVRWCGGSGRVLLLPERTWVTSWSEGCP